MTKLEKKHTLKREAAIERIRELYEKLDEKDSEESERRKPPNISNFPVWKRKQDSSDSDCDSSSTKDSSDCESSSSTDEIRSSTSRLHKQSNSKHQKHDSRRQKNGNHATGHKATLNLLEKFEEQFKRLLKKLIPRVKERIHIIEMLKYHKIDPCQSLSPLQFFYKRLYEYNKARYMAWRKKLEIRNYILSHMNHLDAEAIMRKCNIQRNIPYALRRAQMKRCINVYASIKKIFKVVTKLPRPSLNPADEILWLCNKTSPPTSSTTLEKNSKDAETTAKIITTADADNYPSPITDSESTNHTSTTESTRHRGSIKAPSSTITSKETENTTTSRISPISSVVETATEATNTIQGHITTTSSSSKPSSLTTSETTRRTHRKRLTTSSVPIEQPSPTITIHSKNRTPSRERPKTWSSALTTNAGTATIEGQTESIISNIKPSLVTNDTTEQVNTNGFRNTSRPIDQTLSKTTIRNKNTTHLNEKRTTWNSVGTTATGISKIGGLKETIISNSKPSLITTVKTIVNISSEHAPTANTIQERITTLPKERPVPWSSAHNTTKKPATAARKEEVIISGTKPLLGTTVKTIVNRPSEHTPTANIIQERITTLSKERPVARSSAYTTTKTPATAVRKEEVIIGGSKPRLVTTIKTTVNRPNEHTRTVNIIQERITTLSKERPAAWSSAHNTTKRPATAAMKEEVIISGTKPLLGTTVNTIVNRPSEHTPTANIIREKITTLSKERPVAWSSAHNTTKRPAAVARKEEVTISGSKTPLVTPVKTIVNRPNEHTPIPNVIQERITTLSKERPVAWSSAHTTTKTPATAVRKEEVIIGGSKPPLVATVKTTVNRPNEHTRTANIIQERITTLSKERPAAWSSAHSTTKRPATIARKEEVILSGTNPLLGTTVKTIVNRPSEHMPTANIIQERITTLAKERPVVWSSAHTTTKRPATAVKKEEVIIDGSKPPLVTTVNTIVNRPSEHTPIPNIIQERITTLSKERPVAWSSAHSITKRPATMARKEEVIISGSEPPLVTPVKTIVNRPKEHTPTANIIQERITTLSKEKPVAWSSAHSTTKTSATIARKEEVVLSRTKPLLGTTVKTIVNRPDEHTPKANIIQERITTLSKERPVAWSSAHSTTKRPATMARKEEVIISGSEPPLVTPVKTIVNRPKEHKPTANIIQERITTLSKEKPVAWSSAHSTTKTSATIARKEEVVLSGTKPVLGTTVKTIVNRPSEHKTTANIIQERITTLSKERPVAWSSAHSITKRPATMARKEEVIISGSEPPLVTPVKTIVNRPKEHTPTANIIQERITTLSEEKPVAWSSVHSTTKRSASIARKEEVVLSGTKPLFGTTVKTIVNRPSEHMPTANIIQERITTLSKERPVAWSSAHSITKRPATMARKEEVIISGSEPPLVTPVKTIVNRPDEHTPTANIIQERITTLSKERPVAWSSAHSITKRPATMARKEEVIISGSEPPLVTHVKTIVNRPDEHTPTANIIHERISTLSKERPVAWSSAHSITKRPATMARKEEVIISGSEPPLVTPVKTIVNRPKEHTPAANIIQERITTLSEEKPVAWSSAHSTTKRSATIARKEEVVLSGTKPLLGTTVKTIVNRPSEHMPTANIIQERITTLSKERPVAWSSAHTTTKRPATVARKEEVIISRSKTPLVTSVKTIVNRPDEHTPKANIIQERITTLSKERPVAWSSAHSTTKRPATMARKEEVIISGSEPPLVTPVKTIVNRPDEHTPTANIIQERITTLSEEKPVAWSSAHSTTKRSATIARKEEVVLSATKPLLGTTVKTIVNRPSEHMPTSNIIQDRITTLSKERPVAWTSAHTTTKRPATEARKEEVIISGSKTPLVTPVKTIVNRPNEHTPTANIIQERITTLSKERPVAWSSAHSTTKRPATMARKEEVIISGSEPPLVTPVKTIVNRPDEHTPTANIIQERITTLSEEKPVAWSSAHSTTKRSATIARKEEVVLSATKPLLGTTVKTIVNRPSEHMPTSNIIQDRITTLSKERPVAWTSAHTTTKRPATEARKEEVIISGSKTPLVTPVKTIVNRPNEHTPTANIIQERITTLSKERPVAWSSAHSTTKRPATMARKEEVIISRSEPPLVTPVKTIVNRPDEHTPTANIIHERITTLSKERPVAWSSAHSITKRPATMARKEEVIISGSEPSLVTPVKTIVNRPNEHTPTANIIQERITTLSKERPVAWSSAHSTTKRPATMARKEEVIISGSKPLLGTTVKTIVNRPSEHTPTANIIQERISTLSKETPGAWSSAHTTTKRPASVAKKEDVIISGSEPPLVTTVKTIVNRPNEHTPAANIIQEGITTLSKNRPVAWSSAHTATKKPATVARNEEIIISGSKPPLVTTVRPIVNRPNEHTPTANIIQESISTLSKERPVAWSSAHTTTNRPATVAKNEEVIISGSKPSLLPTAKAIVHSSTGRSTSTPKPVYHTSPGNIVQEWIRSLSREKPAAWSSADTATKRPATEASKEEVVISGSKPLLLPTVKTSMHTSTVGSTNSPGPSEHTSSANIIEEGINTLSRERPTAWYSADTATKRPATVSRKEEVIINGSKPPSVTTVTTIVNRPNEHTPTANIIQKSISTLSKERPAAWSNAHNTAKRPVTAARKEEVIISGTKPSLGTTVKTIVNRPSEHTSTANIIQKGITTLSWERPTAWIKADTISEGTAKTARENEPIIIGSNQSLVTIVEANGHTSGGSSASNSESAEQLSTGTTTHERISRLWSRGPTTRGSPDITDEVTTITGGHKKIIISSSKPSFASTIEGIGHTSTERSTSSSRQSEQTSSGITIHDRISTLSKERPTTWSKANTTGDGTARTARQREAIISGSRSSSVKIVETIGHTSTERPTSRSEPTEQTSPGSTIYDRINTISSRTPTIWSSANTTTEETVTAAKHRETIISNSKPSLGTIIETIVHTDTDTPTSEPTEQTSSGTIIYDRINTISSGTPISWSGADTTIEGTVTTVGH
ncbi:mucin-5AC-like [Osmia bicornis bicornis]|uniref:mucin-5AC-like n=1 Tax=Osmia bicornis bicornis TaxID=1437191 RepID=UPI001EAF89CC|nr:mucin-5AC-like [Osmia bicornis bicornis]